ncbi:hypothetical protein AB0X98_06390 [Rothia koreensis]|uniref:hypothetical protein n=1 Tax=Rothia koreensis TaxID=592378 RepID=UPI003F1F39A1
MTTGNRPRAERGFRSRYDNSPAIVIRDGRDPHQTRFILLQLEDAFTLADEITDLAEALETEQGRPAAS